MRPIIRPCREKDLPAFRELLAQYFREELHLPLSDEQADDLAEDIYAEIAAEVPLALAFRRRRPVGFINYQLDHPESSWCFHPGWGCIRELYVMPEHRGKGIARALVYHAARYAKKHGAAVLYLTADDAIPFWQALGFARSGRVNPKNELEELERVL